MTYQKELSKKFLPTMKKIFNSLKKLFEKNPQRALEEAEAEAVSAFNIMKSDDGFYIAYHGVRVSTSFDSERKEYLLGRLQEYRDFLVAQRLNAHHNG